MPRTYLGEFEELVLLMVAVCDDNAYGVTISEAIAEHAGRFVAFGTVHNTLIRLEEKGFVASHLGGATSERGGRRKRLFRLTAAGRSALQEIRNLREHIWSLLPPYAI